jgi:DNA-binding SARP family transcriptional activator
VGATYAWPMQLGVLGPLQVQRGDDEPVSLGGPRPRAVLAALALRAGQPVSVDRLVDEVWGSDLPAAPSRTLTTVVSRLRTALGDPEAVVSDGAGYRLDVDPESVDAHRFERLVEQGRRCLAGDDPATAARLLREALDLWRGEPLADLADSPLCDWARPQLDELRLQALAARIEADLLLGDCEQLAWELVGLRTEHPLNEALAALQMRALAAGGRRSDALAVYEQTRERLAEELGIDPGEQLARVHLAILRDEPLDPAGTARRGGVRIPDARAPRRPGSRSPHPPPTTAGHGPRRVRRSHRPARTALRYLAIGRGRRGSTRCAAGR